MAIEAKTIPAIKMHMEMPKISALGSIFITSNVPSAIRTVIIEADIVIRLLTLLSKLTLRSISL